jgi:hypothetical protein
MNIALEKDAIRMRINRAEEWGQLPECVTGERKYGMS